jgi:hypothetical protein
LFVVVKQRLVVLEVLLDADGLPERVEVVEHVLEPAARAEQRQQRLRVQELGDVQEDI